MGMEWHHGQYMVEHHQRVIETAAKYGIMINAHEPIKDTGLRRTYPNFMTREGARGQEYNAWDDNPPDHVTILPFTRLLAERWPAEVRAAGLLPSWDETRTFVDVSGKLRAATALLVSVVRRRAGVSGHRAVRAERRARVCQAQLHVPFPT